MKLYTAQLRTADVLRELEAIRRFRPWTFAELYQQINVNGKITDNAQSIARTETYVAADPDDVDSVVALARFYVWDDRPKEAAPLLRRALLQKPREPAIYAYLAEALLGLLDLAGRFASP